MELDADGTGDTLNVFDGTSGVADVELARGSNTDENANIDFGSAGHEFTINGSGDETDFEFTFTSDFNESGDAIQIDGEWDENNGDDQFNLSNVGANGASSFTGEATSDSDDVTVGNTDEAHRVEVDADIADIDFQSGDGIDSSEDLANPLIDNDDSSDSYFNTGDGSSGSETFTMFVEGNDQTKILDFELDGSGDVTGDGSNVELIGVVDGEQTFGDANLA